MLDFIGKDKKILREIFINEDNYKDRKNKNYTSFMWLIVRQSQSRDHTHESFDLGDVNLLFFEKRMFNHFDSNELVLEVFKSKKISRLLKGSYHEMCRRVSEYCAKLEIYATNALIFYEDDREKMVNTNMKKRKLNGINFYLQRMN